MLRCVVTAGPTFEPLDQARRLTNFSTGRLGCELAGFLSGQGHEVTLLIGEGATYAGDRRARAIQPFTTTESLLTALRDLARNPIDAVFHAAAVSDFAFGKVFTRGPAGDLHPVNSGKYSTRSGTLLAELVPTPKIIAQLRDLFAQARIVGWKYEVEGDREAVVRLAGDQIAQCRTDACVANGPAYGLGFGLVRPGGAATHYRDPVELYGALNDLAAGL